MRWEYAYLVRTTYPARSWHTLYGSDGQKEVDGNGGIEILNRLGQEGWELVTVETSLYQGSTERTYWLKRPVNTGTSR